MSKFHLPSGVIQNFLANDLLGSQYVSSKVAHKLNDPVIVGWFDLIDYEGIPTLTQQENCGFFISQKPLYSRDLADSSIESHVFGGYDESEDFTALGIYLVSHIVGNGRFKIVPAWDYSQEDLQAKLTKIGYPRLAKNYFDAHQELKKAFGVF